MIRRQSFLDPATGRELVLPITPSSYRWEHGINLETVNIEGLGDVSLPGHGTLDEEQIACVFPAHFYPWLEQGAVTNPFIYLQQLERWIDEKTVLRYLVSGTPTNAAVRIKSVSYGEQDGTNDVYATITIKQHRAPELGRGAAPGSSAVTLGGDGTRNGGSAVTAGQSYEVKKGDTLWGIARRFYGDGRKYPLIAAANKVKNPNLIFVGTVLAIPPEGAR